MATSSLASSSSAPLPFDDIFFKDILTSKDIHPSHIIRWIEEASDGALKVFKRDYLDKPIWYLALVERIGVSPEAWLAAMPPIIAICLGEVSSHAKLHRVDSVLAGFLVQLETTTHVPGNAMEGSNRARRHRMDACLRLMFTALLDLEKHPNGEFRRLLGGRELRDQSPEIEELEEGEIREGEPDDSDLVKQCAERLDYLQSQNRAQSDEIEALKAIIARLKRSIQPEEADSGVK